MGKPLIQEEVIRRFKEKHGDRYGYDKVEFKGCGIKVEIVCKEHGSFFQIPNNHFKGRGCHKCPKQTRTTERFIEKARQIHKDVYDYSKVNYISVNVKVEIVCKIHKSFWMRPSNHLNGQGCHKCGKLLMGCKQTSNTEEFIEKAKKVHGDKYVYDKVNYIKSYEPVEIICKKHKSFWMIPNSHLNGKGCPECGKLLIGLKQTSNREEFIEKAKKIHGDEYVYDKVNYIKSYEPVEIICKIHKSFWMRPRNHLCGQGCKKCRRIAFSVSRTSNTEEFIEKAKKMHGDKYVYDKVNYKGYNVKVEIVCKICGSFWVTPTAHLSGCGCSECNKRVTALWMAKDILTKLEKIKQKDNSCRLYYFKITRIDGTEKNFYKIGVSNILKARMRQIEKETKEKYKVKILQAWKGTLYECLKVEIEMHEEFAVHSYKPKFRFSGHTECFSKDVLRLDNAKMKKAC